MNFPTTHWSLLAQATHDDSVEARKALELLCGKYWGPIHEFIRSRGVPDPEAQDLTQDFMAHLLASSFFSRADRVRGRFRSFLLGALVRFLWDAADKQRALKRGGGLVHVSLAEGRLDEGELAGCDPEAVEVFDREWAIATLESALQRVRREYQERGHGSLLKTLEEYLPGSIRTPSYEEGARELGLPLGTLKTEVHRLRRRLRTLLREEVAETVSAPHEIEQEMIYLQEVLSKRDLEIAQTVKPWSANS